MLPYAERHRRAQELNRKVRTAALVATALGLAVATGLYVLSASSEDSPNFSKGQGGSGGGRWEVGVGGALRAPVRAAKRAAAVAADYWRRWRSGGAGGRDERGLGHGAAVAAAGSGY